PAAASTFKFTGFPSTVTAGAIVTFSITAQDTFGNVVPNYAGTVHFSTTDTRAALPGDVTLTNGVGAFRATLKSSGNWTVTAADLTNSSIAGSTSAIFVSAASANHLVVTGVPSASVTA